MINQNVHVMREVVEKLTQMLAQRGIKVTQIGMRAYVQHDLNGKPVRVNLPYIPDDATEDLLLAVQGFLDHEVGHLLFSDFKVLSEAAKLSRDKKQPEFKALHNVLNIVEDTFVERKMREKFPGSDFNLNAVSDFYLKKFIEPKLACRKSPKDLVFPNGAGNVESNRNILSRCWGPLQIKAGMLDKNGKPMFNGKTLRHFRASILIDLGATAKELQTSMGHATIQMTYDVYGHLLVGREQEEKEQERVRNIAKELL